MSKENMEYLHSGFGGEQLKKKRVLSKPETNEEITPWMVLKDMSRKEG